MNIIDSISGILKKKKLGKKGLPTVSADSLWEAIEEEWVCAIRKFVSDRLSIRNKSSMCRLSLSGGDSQYLDKILAELLCSLEELCGHETKRQRFSNQRKKN